MVHVYCLYSLELPRLGDSNENKQHTFMLKEIKNISLLCLLTWCYDCLISSNYPGLEHTFMALKVFEPLKFYLEYITAFSYRCTIKADIFFFAFHIRVTLN